MEYNNQIGIESRLTRATNIQSTSTSLNYSQTGTCSKLPFDGGSVIIASSEQKPSTVSPSKTPTVTAVGVKENTKVKASTTAITTQAMGQDNQTTTNFYTYNNSCDANESIETSSQVQNRNESRYNNDLVVNNNQQQRQQQQHAHSQNNRFALIEASNLGADIVGDSTLSPNSINSSQQQSLHHSQEQHGYPTATCNDAHLSGSFTGSSYPTSSSGGNYQNSTGGNSVNQPLELNACTAYYSNLQQSNDSGLVENQVAFYNAQQQHQQEQHTNDLNKSSPNVVTPFKQQQQQQHHHSSSTSTTSSSSSAPIKFPHPSSQSVQSTYSSSSPSYHDNRLNDSNNNWPAPVNNNNNRMTMLSAMTNQVSPVKQLQTNLNQNESSHHYESECLPAGSAFSTSGASTIALYSDIKNNPMERAPVKYHNDYDNGTGLTYTFNSQGSGHYKLHSQLNDEESAGNVSSNGVNLVQPIENTVAYHLGFNQSPHFPITY